MSLESIRNSINKQFKGDVVGYGNCIPKFERIPFSSARLNYMTRGGLPRGACVEFSGPEESGKTTLLADVVKNAQKMGLLCSFTDTENKAQPLDSLILTDNGFKEMREMKVGTKIYGNDGLLHTVTGVYPRGLRDVYQVTFSDNTTAKCCNEHLWMVQHLYDRQYMLSHNKPEDYNYQVLRLEQIVSDGIKLYGKNSKEGSNKYYIPVNKAMNFSSRELPLDPYLVGVLIGDGGLVNKVMFSSSEEDIINSVKAIVKEYGCMLNKISGSAYDWAIVKDTDKSNSHIKNPIKEILISLDLYGKHSYEKHIPQEYLYSSISDRTALLKGLMDADGFVKGVQSYNYVTTSKQLSEDVAFLCRTLGCVVKVHQRKSSYTDNGCKVECRDKYELHINTPMNLLPFSSHKHFLRYDKFKECCSIKREEYKLKKSIKSIEFVGKEECQCIRTDNPSHLYITNDFIVTHNTDMEYWKYLGVDLSKLLVCKPTGMTGEQILELQFELIAQGINLLGLDSVASLVPSSVFENSMEEKTYCGSSSIMSTFSQKLSGSGILYQYNATLIGVNQVRDKIGGYGGGFNVPGGHFWKHACIARLQLVKGHPFDKNYKELNMSATEDIAGHYIDVRMLKNQFCRNDRKLATVAYCYADAVLGGVEDLLDVAMLYGIVVQGGAWYRIVNPATGELLCVNNEELKFQGRANIRNYLLNTPQIYRWLDSQVNALIQEESSQCADEEEIDNDENDVESQDENDSDGSDE